MLGRLGASQRGRRSPLASALASILRSWRPLAVSLAYFGSRLAPLGLLFGDCLVFFGACLRARGGCQGLRIRKNCKIDAPTIGAYMGRGIS